MTAFRLKLCRHDFNLSSCNNGTQLPLNSTIANLNRQILISSNTSIFPDLFVMNIYKCLIKYLISIKIILTHSIVNKIPNIYSNLFNCQSFIIKAIFNKLINSRGG